MFHLILRALRLIYDCASFNGRSRDDDMKCNLSMSLNLYAVSIVFFRVPSLQLNKKILVYN